MESVESNRHAEGAEMAPLDPIGVIHPLVAAAFQALDRSGRPWVLLRGESELAQPSGDVDLLVHPSALPELDDLMAEVRFVRVVAAGRGSHRFYFAFDSDSGRWVKLDVVSSIEFGRFQQWPTPLAEGCLRRRQRLGPVSRPTPEDRGWLELLHLVLDKGRIAPDRIQAARTAAAQASSNAEVARYLDDRLGAGTAERLRNVVVAGSPSEIAEVVAAVNAGWAATAPRSSQVRSLRNRAGRLLSPTLGGRPTRGMAVAVMGPDGAGKTTLLHGVADEFPVPAKYVYMGLWSQGRWDPWLHRLPGGRLGQKMVRVARGSVTARYHRLRGRLVLLDRIAYDTQLPGSVDNSVGGRITAAVAHRLGPRPDLLMVLDAPGEVMFARKGEHSVEVLERWRRAYLDLAERLPMSVVLDATSPQSVVLSRGTDLVWRRFSAKDVPDDPAGMGGSGSIQGAPVKPVR
jgi:thymidylate kinase